MEGKGNKRKGRLKHTGKALAQYLPWFLLLLGVDGFAALLLWIADLDAFWALSGMICLASAVFFAAVCAALLFRERGREKVFLAFLETPDEYHEE